MPNATELNVVKTNGDFLEMLVSTKAGVAVDAKNLLNKVFTFQLAKTKVTGGDIEEIAELFAHFVFPSLKSLEHNKSLHKEKLRQINDFFAEISSIASKFGVKVNLAEANSILEQAKFKR